MLQQFKIGEVARMLQVSIEALRLWERKGLTPKPHRRPTGLRTYSSEDIEAIRKHLKQR